MYFLTALNKNFDKRCFGYYHDEANALQAVFENLGDMHESCYDFIVIEKVYSGVHGRTGGQQWFQWKKVKRLSQTKGWVAINRPVWSRGISNWAVG